MICEDTTEVLVPKQKKLNESKTFQIYEYIGAQLTYVKQQKHYIRTKFLKYADWSFKDTISRYLSRRIIGVA